MIQRFQQLRVVAWLVLAILVISACAPSGAGGPGPATESRTLVVSGFGGLWDESFKNAVVKPFEAKNPGVKITHLISGPAAEMVARIRAEKGKPTIDIVGTGTGFERLLTDEGLLEDFDAAKMPNLKSVFPSGIYKNNVVANSFAGVGIAYHKDRVKSAPTSWYDLWDPAFGKVAIGDIVNTYGYALFAFINELQGGTETNQDPGWKKFEELISKQCPITAVSTDDTINAIVGRGAAMSVVPNSRAIQLMKEGYPLGFVYPKEGAMAWGTYMGVVKNTTNKALAMEFINFWLDPQVQSQFNSAVNYGPANTQARLPSDYKFSDYLITGDALTKAKILNWTYITKNVPTWTEKWTRQIVPMLEKCRAS